MTDYSQLSEDVDNPTAIGVPTGVEVLAAIDEVYRRLERRPLNSDQIEDILKRSKIDPKTESDVFCGLNEFFIGYDGNRPVYSAKRSWEGYKFTRAQLL